MKRNEILDEHKKGVRAVKYNVKPKAHIEPPKPRNPVAKNAGAAIGGGAAGAHKDAKKASQAVRGQKHKAAELAEMDSQGYTGSRDDYKLGGPEGTGKAMKAKEFAKKALDILNKAEDEEWYDRDGRPNPKGAYDAGGHYHMDRDVEEMYGRRRDAYQRDYDSSIAGMSGRRREVDDEANLMYRYKPETGKLVQKMVDVRDEYEAKSMGWRYEWKDALRVANIIQSKFDPNKFVQKMGNKWVPVNPFKDKEEPKQDDVAEGEGKVTAVDPTKGVEITNPETGVKTTIPPKMSSALAPDKANPNRYTLNPQTVTGSDEKDAATGPKVGSQVAIPDQATEQNHNEPPSDSTSPIHGGSDSGSNEEHDMIISLLKKLLHKGVDEMDNGPVSVQTSSKGDLGQMKKMAGL